MVRHLDPYWMENAVLSWIGLVSAIWVAEVLLFPEPVLITLTIHTVFSRIHTRATQFAPKIVKRSPIGMTMVLKWPVIAWFSKWVGLRRAAEE